MTEAREISAERLDKIQGMTQYPGTAAMVVVKDLLAHIAFQKAALEAATARAGELRDSVARLEGLCQAHHEVSREAEARATAAEAEAARLRDLLKTARDTKWTCGQCGHEEGFYDFKSIIDQALSPAPGVSVASEPDPGHKLATTRRVALITNKDVRGTAIGDILPTGWLLVKWDDGEHTYEPACHLVDAPEPPPAPAPEPSEEAMQLVKRLHATPEPDDIADMPDAVLQMCLDTEDRKTAAMLERLIRQISRAA